MADNDTEKTGDSGGPGEASGTADSRFDRLEKKIDRIDEALGRIEDGLGRSDRRPAESGLPRHRTISPFWGLVLVIIGLVWMAESWPFVHNLLPPFLFGLGIILIVIYYLKK